MLGHEHEDLIGEPVMAVAQEGMEAEIGLARGGYDGHRVVHDYHMCLAFGLSSDVSWMQR